MPFSHEQNICKNLRFLSRISSDTLRYDCCTGNGFTPRLAPFISAAVMVSTVTPVLTRLVYCTAVYFSGFLFWGCHGQVGGTRFQVGKTHQHREYVGIAQETNA